MPNKTNRNTPPVKSMSSIKSTSPIKSKSKDNDKNNNKNKNNNNNNNNVIVNSPTIIRRQQCILHDNQAIPESRFEYHDEEHGRVLAFDIKVELSPVLTSARKDKRDNEVFDVTDVLSQGLANLKINGVAITTPPQQQEAVIPEKVNNSASLKRSNQKKKKQDEEWVFESDTESEKEAESLSNDQYYDAEDEDDLAWGCKNSDDEESDSDDDDGNCYKTFREDPFSPERAKGIIEYTVPGDKSGTVTNVRRSSRNSFGSPQGRLSFGSPVGKKK